MQETGSCPGLPVLSVQAFLVLFVLGMKCSVVQRCVVVHSMWVYNRPRASVVIELQLSAGIHFYMGQFPQDGNLPCIFFVFVVACCGL